MKIEVAPEVFILFPGYVRHVLVVRGADNSKESEELAELLMLEQRRVRENDAFIEPKEHPLVASWRDAFLAFGTNPNKCPPSIANLLKRVRSGKDLPYVNSLVAIFNIVSMRHVLPAGGDDLDTVKGDIRLTRAKGNENYTPLGSPDQRERPNPGEIVLLDAGSEEVLCRAWCWKNGDVSKIETSTQNVAINIDAMPPKTAEEGKTAALETLELVKRFCGGEIELYRLDAQCSMHNVQ
ncbi:MAG: phenylalanine--tRNA ligase beta subunit-related protein [Synergistaceae bacterium]|nr:phenylalanine--tRNA ligase beta subunit-related protein [Synergistaceae bacterium]